MAAVSETPSTCGGRALAALIAVAGDSADDDRVNRIVARAIGQLRQQRCQPHWWAWPRPGDESLRCDVCERRIRYAGLSTPAATSILAAYEKRHGLAQAAEFLVALQMARDADRANGAATRREDE